METVTEMFVCKGSLKIGTSIMSKNRPCVLRTPKKDTSQKPLRCHVLQVG